MNHKQLYAMVKGILEEPSTYDYFIHWASDRRPTTAAVSLIRRRDGTVVATHGDSRLKIEPVLDADGNRLVFADEAAACEWAWAWIRTARVPPPIPTPSQEARGLASGLLQIDRAKRLLGGEEAPAGSAVYAAAVERLIELVDPSLDPPLELPDGTHPNAADDTIRILDDSMRHFERGDTRSGSAAGWWLLRMLASAPDEHDPDSRLLAAVNAVDAARVAATTGNIATLPRDTVRAWATQQQPLARYHPGELGTSGVFVPSTPHETEGSCVEMTTVDGTRSLPVFTCRDLFDEWVAATGARETAADLMRVGMLGEIASSCDGVTVNPLQERFFLSLADLAGQ